MKKKSLVEIEKRANLFGIFRTVAYIGDSLSSGEVVSKTPDNQNRFNDFFDQSWGQYMARKFNHTAYNFSRGGMTAKEYMTGWADQNRCFEPARAAQAYFIALGANDLNRDLPFGSLADVHPDAPETNADTFAGWYGRIISKYKSIQPRAKFFLVTLAREYDQGEKKLEQKIAHKKLLNDFKKIFDNIYVIDLLDGIDEYDETFKRRHWMNGHLTPAGYLMTAEIIGELANDIVYENIDDFRDVAFIGTDLYEKPQVQ